MSPVKYELEFYSQEDDILHNHRRENLRSYTASCGLQGRFCHIPQPEFTQTQNSLLRRALR
jgi:hypothetical protein